MLLCGFGKTLTMNSSNIFDDLFQANEFKTEKIMQYVNNPLVDINAQNPDGLTILHFAVIYNLLSVILAILTNGNLNLNIRDSKGCTPLHYAAFTNNTDIILNLVKAPDFDVNVQDHSGKTPLHYCA